MVERRPPPARAGAGGRCRDAAGQRAGALLGLDPATERSDHEADLPAGAALVLYTDGLVERRDRPLPEGLAVLAQELGALAHLPVEELADALLARMLPEAHEDDVAVVVVRGR